MVYSLDHVFGSLDNPSVKSPRGGYLPGDTSEDSPETTARG